MTKAWQSYYRRQGISMGRGLALGLHGIEASVYRMSNLRKWELYPLQSHVLLMKHLLKNNGLFLTVSLCLTLRGSPSLKSQSFTHPH